MDEGVDAAQPKLALAGVSPNRCLEIRQRRGGVAGRDGQNAEVVVGIRMIGPLGEYGVIAALRFEEAASPMMIDRLLKHTLHRLPESGLVGRYL